MRPESRNLDTQSAQTLGGSLCLRIFLPPSREAMTAYASYGGQDGESMRVFSYTLLSAVYGELENSRMDERGHPARPTGLETDLTWAEGGAAKLVIDQADLQSVEFDTIPKRRRSDSVVGHMEVDDAPGVLRGGVLPKISCGVLRRT